RIGAHVREALRAARPVVALESTVITHGLPRPRNLEAALRLERVVEAAGAVPATVGVLDGEVVVGLARDELERLATASAEKASLWNLAAVVARRGCAGTTVATTLWGGRARLHRRVRDGRPRRRPRRPVRRVRRPGGPRSPLGADGLRRPEEHPRRTGDAGAPRDRRRAGRRLPL